MARSDADIDLLLRRLPAPPLDVASRERILSGILQRIAVDPERVGDMSSEPESGGRTGRRRRGVRWTRRRVAVVAGAAALVVVGGGTAVAMLSFERAPVRSVAHCFPFVTSDFTNPALGPDVAFSGGDTAAAAIDACTAEWATGALVPTPPYAGSPGPSTQPVPPLVACVLPSGVVGVFPGPAQTCTRLGLPRSEG
jgi:hypothetical protein